ncbi:hypothetical protein CHLNCDRAFT_141480 [Chlorella variabilis]|uniref:Maltase n=1 Tax=Chlorella variabilis TaxID=554065 RepID=E1ZSY6_CHLVA|nr:hypothetical protein CHLNCDRAFT_141480 [Chlorella variabilis]EFN51090.1 hypothetical protein CHLNCDRAFT_141480 [Chlorella variabilis]|eukprot:XP_005843192.1 hypothetical protein CHLNCDRAFT_141480 [Chlorella variabilis]
MSRTLLPAPALALLLAACLTSAAPPLDACDRLGPRVQCGSIAVSQRTCEEQDCCWTVQPLDTEPWQPDVFLPSCFYPNTGASEYALQEPSVGLAEGDMGNATLTNMTSTQPELGGDFQTAALSVEEFTPGKAHHVLRIRIIPLNASAPPRWEVPPEFFAPDSLLAGGDGGGTQPVTAPRQFEVDVEDAPFGFTVLRVDRQSGAPLATTFNSSGLRLILKASAGTTCWPLGADQYLELSTHVDAASYIYGGGERSSETTYMTRNGYPYAGWARDQNPQVPMRNTYSSWPFALVLEQDGTAWGALLLNSNGMEMAATPDKLTWRAIGGAIDLFVFLGPTPLDVIDQLTAVVGRPVMQPFWAFGFHQYGYKTVWENFVSRLHANDQHWVPILDPGIKIDEGFDPYLDGLQQNAYILDERGDPYIGWVWPGGCHFPDFGFNPAVDAYWLAQLDIYNGYAQWDGLWIDMNEIANFCTGNVCHMPTAEAVANQRGFPPFQCQLLCYDSLTAGLSNADLALTSSVLARHAGDVLEYDAHNLYGLAEARVTAAAIRLIKGTRPFILTRATRL